MSVGEERFVPEFPDAAARGEASETHNHLRDGRLTQGAMASARELAAAQS
jgi:hypothetical protein